MTTLEKQQKEQKEQEIGDVPFNNQQKGTGFSNRLKQVIGDRSGRAFAKEAGISYSTLHNYLTDVSSPTLDNLIALSNATGVSIQWLATGEKEKHIERNSLVEVFEQAKATIEDISMIAAYPSINVSAGFGSFNEGVTEPEGEEPYSDVLLSALGVKAHQCAVFWAYGTSMSPTIADGDQMLVDLSQTEIKGDNIYLVQNEDSVWVKRIKKEWNYIELISDNDAYRPIQITAEEAQNLKIIGQVVHIGHSLV